MAFGLVSLLVVLGICMLIFRQVEFPVLQKGHDAQNQAAQISGRDENGMPAMSSYTAQAHERAGGHMDGITIKTVIPGGPMQAYYGLAPGDVVVKIGEMRVPDIGVQDDYEMAKAQLDEAYQRMKTLTVVRNKTELVLPLPAPATPATPAPAPAVSSATPASSTPAPSTPATPPDNSIGGQLRGIEQGLKDIGGK
jgi:hypothetical protein